MERFIRFLTRYVLVGLFVSVLIVAAAHVLEVTALPAPLQPVDAFVQTNAVLRSASSFLRENLFWDWNRDGSSSLFGKESEGVSQSGDLFQPVTQSEPRSPAEAADGVPPAQPLVTPRPTKPSAPAVTPGWGVVFASTAKAYTTAGKFLFRPEPGTVVKVTDIRTTKSGELASCYPLAGPHGSSRVLIPVADLNLQAGTISDVSRAVRDLCVREAQLMGAIDKVKREAKKSLRADNPHAQEYGKIKAAYIAYWKKVKALQAQRDDARGDDHVRISDELRALKGDDIRLGQDYEAAKKKYDDWNRAHPAGPGENTRLATLEKELSLVQARLDEIDAGN